MKYSLDLLPFIVEALGGCKRAYDDIDKLYQTKRYQFYKTATKHELYNHQIVTGGSLLQEEYCKKILGIIAYALSHEDEELLLKVEQIIEKGFPWTCLYVKNHLKVDISEFISAYKKKFHGVMDDFNNPVESHFAILMFLSLIHEKEIIQNESYDDVAQMFIGMAEHYKDGNSTRISTDKITQEDKVKIKDLKKLIYKKYGVIKNYDNLNKIEKIDNSAIPKFEQCSFLFDFESLSSISIFDNVEFGEQDIDKILWLYVLSGDDLFDLEKALTFLVSNMYILYLIKAYKQVKEMYFANNKETMYVELDGLESRLKVVEAERNAIEKNFKESLSEIELLRRENERLKVELEEEKRNRQELNALRAFIFALDEREEYSSVNIPLEELKSFKAVLIGGHEKWQQKMKEYLPNFVFIRTDNLNFDVKLLDGVKVIYVFTNYLSHAIYYRLMSAIENKDVKVVYLQNQNEELVLKEVYKTYN